MASNTKLSLFLAGLTVGLWAATGLAMLSPWAPFLASWPLACYVLWRISDPRRGP